MRLCYRIFTFVKALNLTDEEEDEVYHFVRDMRIVIKEENQMINNNLRSSST